jgi:transcriptional regulator with XRE-family HTH domain
LEINDTKCGKRCWKRQNFENAKYIGKFWLSQRGSACNILANALNFCQDVFCERSTTASRPCSGRAGLAKSRHLVQKDGNGCARQCPGDRSLLDVSKAMGVGGNIRQLRMAKGLTLDRLASLSELTRGYISLVERGLKIPSIAALLRMAKALDVNVTYFFDPNPQAMPRYTLFRQEDRSTTRDAGFELVALAAGRTGKMMEPFLMSPPLKSAFRASHGGEEMLFVVNGRIAIKLDGEELTLSKGDCLYFSGETPHEVRSLGRQRAEILVVVAQTPSAPAD